ncbi:cellulose synthase/poly-beta-1,6-N-acetylglucosamine synthase-like glycosyltransferase [Propionicimonas paludicola]|uniref:Cellulose synthase/poly-beta-1,6-N-acetylglucosamine synthase-like glycosyltransferase n=1 Tax=Propionicimonas paludicola TaxID=185243 RepID=A0A2A9CUW3_9ACTN|nr:cellulose synthase/poly-beta-1,6-N-acetylglucosamine synthase-like glycosyltransferase [Propionicimonas paludicola]
MGESGCERGRLRKGCALIAVLLTVCTVGLVISGLYGVYQVAVSIRFGGKLPTLPDAEGPAHKFAVLVFARNEEVVIGQLLNSLNDQDYPSDAFQVFVTADNCTDRTAEIAREAGAVVYERSSGGPAGKGAALTWFFQEHFPEGFDACVVFDADNVVDPGYLAAMNRQLAAGNPIAVGYRMGKNPSSSWVAGANTIFWLMQSRFIHLPRAMWNLPCTTVGGTGFMFSLSVLGNNGWQTSSACEDIEFTLKAIANGWHVAFAEDALFFDEQPLTFSQSLIQRYRWSVGTVQLVRTAVPQLLASVRRGQLSAMDGALYIIGVTVGGLSSILWLASVVLGLASGAGVANTLVTLLVGTVVGYLVLLAFSLLVVRLERARWTGMSKAVLGFPVWLFAWSIINVVVLFYRDPTWHIVNHTENLSLAESAQLSSLPGRTS